jgi:Fur family peroxide stress response transcriptional regulator
LQLRILLTKLSIVTVTATPGSAKKPALSTAKPAAAAFERHLEALLDRVRERGLKLTPQRIAILRELAGDPTHPTAQELFERLRPSLPTMSFATVYNTLDALASAGLCAALSLAPGAARFDSNMEAHHHAVCDRCGLIRDIPIPTAASAAAPSPEEPSLAVPGFTVRSVEKIFRGLCADCAAKSARAARRKASPQKPSQSAQTTDPEPQKGP